MKEIQLNAEASVSLEVTDDNTAVAAGSGSLRLGGGFFGVLSKVVLRACGRSNGFCLPLLRLYVFRAE